MQEIPTWKPVLMVAALGLCAWWLYPPQEKLKPGLDLAGGTTLVYQIDVPQGQDARSVIDQTIASLQKRVDPNGVMNLVWRRQAGNRIEIQVPPPPPEAKRRLSDYLEKRDQLADANIARQHWQTALRADPSQRDAIFDRLSQDNAMRRDLFTELTQAHSKLTDASEPYHQAQDLVRSLEDALADPSTNVTEPGDTTEPTDPESIEAQLEQARQELVSRTRFYLDAKKRVESLEHALAATNIDLPRLEMILNLPDTPRRGPDGKPQASQRQAQLDLLAQTHPQRALQITAVAQAHQAYQEIKGPIDDPNDLIALLRGSGVLEFRIAPAPNLPGVDDYRKQLLERGPNAGPNKPYRWFAIDDVSSFAEDPRDQKRLLDNPEAYFIASNPAMVGQGHADKVYLLLANSPAASMTQNQPDWKLSRAFPTRDDRGFPAASFRLNRTGGNLMGALTGNHLKMPMAIVLDGRVISAPSINSQIQDSGIITGGRGGFAPQELEYLLRTLNAGSLQGQMSEQPIYVRKFGPQLGQDNLHHGLQAAVWALIVVAVIMTGYYLVTGVVANLALAANMVMILGVMALLKATFTLPGIAGIVLTIGMAVDANVLIFERIREELDRKADILTAVRVGYGKALKTIIDANITTLITCVVLYYTATAEIRGFAVTLMVGICATMFTAVFCTRVVIDAYLNFSKKSSLGMLPSMIPSLNRMLSPNVDWVGKSPLFMGLSALAIAGGITMLSTRGTDLLDIEFRSGTQVSFNLAEGKSLSLADVRNRLTDASKQSGLEALAGDRATVVTTGQADGAHAAGFSIATLETDASAVSAAIKSAFADVLDVQQPIGFGGMGQGHDTPRVASAPVYAVRSSQLGENIARPDVRIGVEPYLGGVAIVLEGLDPPVGVGELTQRIQRTRMQPAYEGIGYRPFQVVGVDLATTDAADGMPRYRTAVVVSSDANVNYLDEPDTFTLAGGLADTEWRLVHDALRRDASLDSVSNFSSQISNTMKQQATVALIGSLLAVVVYIWGRFGTLRYGMAAIAALTHDVLIALGLLAAAGMIHESAIGQALGLEDFKINLAIVAAVLTIVGYSLNDTIIVFDRVRENRGRLAVASKSIVNDAINQTISRTVMTSGTTLAALLTLYLFGGDGVHGFAYSMIIGVMVGTYSSVAIAAPLLLIGGGKDDRPKADTETSTGHSAPATT